MAAGTVTVNKSDLIDKIQQNREAHRAIFEAALEKYREKYIELVGQALDAVKAGKKEPQLLFQMPVPEDHTEDYDEALDRLKWEIEDEVTLDQSEFRELVLNKWGWERSFMANSASYVHGR